MARVSVTIDSKLPRVGANLRREVNRSVREQVLTTEGDVSIGIVKYGAVDTGTMLGSVRGEMTGETTGNVSVNAESADGSPYPLYVNFGTRYVPARPFFSDAVEKARTEFPERFKGLAGGLTR